MLNLLNLQSLPCRPQLKHDPSADRVAMRPLTALVTCSPGKHAKFKKVLFILFIHIYKTMPSYGIKKLQLRFSTLNDEFSAPILLAKLVLPYESATHIEYSLATRK